MNYEDMVTFKPTRPTGRIALAQSAFPPSVQLRFHHRIASKKICQGGSVRAHTVSQSAAASARVYNGPSQLPPPPQPLILIFNLVRNPPQPLTPPSLLSSPLLFPPLTYSRESSATAITDIHISEQGKPLSLSLTDRLVVRLLNERETSRGNY